MNTNKYDDQDFFNKYQEMARSKYGLEAAGEWKTMKSMLPTDFKGKRVLDIGCGYGWHCFYALEQGALSVVGIDNSNKMLQMAESKAKTRGLLHHGDGKLEFKLMSIEEMNFDQQDAFDIIISSLAFHYVASFDDVVSKVASILKPNGDFVFSVEHPIFTSYGTGDWIYNDKGKPDHWPVDHYFTQGQRTTHFLGCQVTKYHKTLTTYMNTLVNQGLFQITKVIEPLPDQEMLATMPDEARRPMMLLIAAKRTTI